MSFAVIKTGGKQYKVAANDVIKIEKLDGALPGDVVTFDQVLMVGNGDDVTVGAPLVDGVLVAGHLVETKKQRTVLIIKKHRRQHYDRRNGHRQVLSTVRIGEILLGRAKPTLVADERIQARAAALLGTTPAVTEAPAAPKKAKAVKAAAPAAEAAEKPAKATKAKAEKPAAEKATKAKAEKPAAEKKPAAKKKAAPKADQE